jgi:chloramphenicol O-acetyltransferase type A
MKASRIDLSTYKRKEHFEFFSQFDEPFFGMAANVNCTEAYHFCKQQNCSFYAFYTHVIAKAINEIEALRTRIIEEELWLLEETHVSATVLREDETFAFSRIPYHKDFSIFQENMQREIEQVKQTEGLNLVANEADVFHYSSVPWVQFTAISHARKFKTDDSIPKLSVGKMLEEGSEKLLPISIHVNHAVVDGLQVGQFFEKCEAYFKIE